MIDFWDVHGIFFVIFLFFFPRITLFFSNIASGGILWWLGFIFAPRLLIAIIATSSYWNTNRILVIITWFWAIGFESGEKAVIKKSHKHFRK